MTPQNWKPNASVERLSLGAYCRPTRAETLNTTVLAMNSSAWQVASTATLRA